MLRIMLLFLIALMAAPAQGQANAPQGFCRGGQVFVTWPEHATAKEYVISRVEGAKLATVARVPQGSGIDFIAQRWADMTGKKVEPQSFTIQPQRRLSLGTGLWVHTVKSKGKVKYQIAADGSEIGRVTIEETPGAPAPILESVKPEGKLIERTYIHWATPEMSLFDGHPFKLVVWTDKESPAKAKLPFYVALLGGGKHGPISWSRAGCVALAPQDSTWGLPTRDTDWWRNYDWWYGYSDKINTDGIQGSTIVNYTEKRLLYTIKWAIKTFPVDANRVYLTGGSMGGTGALTFGLRHPELFAAIDAKVPLISPALDGIGDVQVRLERLWGNRNYSLKTNEGENVWDRQNMKLFVAKNHHNLPFIKTNSGRGDEILPWFEVPPFYKALQESRHGFASFWGPGGHNNSGKGATKEYGRFKIERFKKNESYPAISNLSVNGNPGDGTAASGDTAGFMNAGLDWEKIVDTPTRWEITLKPVDPKVKNATLDLTPRRLRMLVVKPRLAYRFKNVDAKTGKILQQGTVRPDKWNLLTVEKLTVSADGNRIVIERQQ